MLAELDGEFDAMYAGSGRPSVPPETLLKATVLMALYSIRSERAFCERLNYDLLFKWFLDLPIDAQRSTRPRSPRTATGCWTMRSRTGSSPWWSARPSSAAIVSSEHFSVDGTLLEAWASHKSFKPKDSRAGTTVGGSQRRGQLPR